ncbi:MAG: hypothetical protein ACR2F5_05045 [Candidatus Limnocylindria bacterium]
MRIYDGAPRQDWEEVLRCVGAFADREGLKELLLLEKENGFFLQGLLFMGGGAAFDNLGSLGKRSYDLSDERIAEMMDAGHAKRGSGVKGMDREITNYYELALRLIGAFIDSQKAHDVFFFEQEGSFVVRLFGTAGSQAGAHTLSEFTREEMLAMIGDSQQRRR